MVIRQIGPGMITQQAAKCSACSGTGSTIAEKDKCTTCVGERTVKEKKTLEVFVTKGMRNGERVTFKGEADESPDTLPGDVVVVLQVSEHPLFRRDGMNLFMKRTITLLEALTGFEFQIQHLDGRLLTVKPEGGMVVKPGSIKAIHGEGMPRASNPFERGNLYVELDVEFPKPGELDEKAVRALTAVLPRPPKTDGTKSAATSSAASSSSSNGVDESHDVSLVDVDMDVEKRKWADEARAARSHGGEAYEEDDEDDEDHPRRGGAQCHQQ